MKATLSFSTEKKFFKNTIICSYNIFEYLKEHVPKGTLYVDKFLVPGSVAVLPSAYAKEWHGYYFDEEGKMTPFELIGAATESLLESEL